MSAGTAPELQDPPGYDRFHRLVKARADLFQRPLFDDRNEIVSPAITDPDEAMRASLRSLRNFSEQPGARDEIRAYIAGTRADLPEGWLWDPQERIISQQTMMDRGDVAAAKQFREEHPVRAAAFDYVVGPAQRLVTAGPQVLLDVAVGIPNFLGGEIRAPEVRTLATSAFQGLLGRGFDVEGMERTQRAMQATADTAAGVIGTAAEIPGMVRSLGGKSVLGSGGGKLVQAVEALPSKVLGAGAKLGETAGKAVGLGERGLGYARGAGAFAAYEAIAAKGPDGAPLSFGESMEAGAKGLVGGAVLHKTSLVAQSVMRGILGKSAAALDPAAKDAAAALRGYAEAKRLSPGTSETGEAFGKRIVDTWIRDGMPGAQNVEWRKLFGHAIAGGVEGAGLPLLDMAFWSDAIATAQTGDPEATQRVIESFAGSILGMGASRVRLQDIPGLQRRVPTARPEPKPTAQEPQTQEPVQGPERNVRAEVLGKLRADIEARLAVQPLERFGWVEAPTAKPPEGVTEIKLEQPLVPVQGGGTAQGEGTLYELPGTPFSFRLNGDMMTLSPDLARLFGFGSEPVHVSEMRHALERASLHSALDAKMLLPGTEISAEGIKAVPGAEGNGTMRTIRLGIALEAPLGPAPQWKPVETFPARGKDPIPPEQQEAVQVLREMLNERSDWAQADVTLLSKSIEVLDTVSARNDAAVAETLAVLPHLVQGLAEATPQQASLNVKALAEMLTVKSPQVAVQDMQPPTARQAKEGGFVDVGSAAETVKNVASRVLKQPGTEGVRLLGKLLGSVYDRQTVRGFTQGLVEKVRERHPEEGERMLAVEANTRRLEDKFAPVLKDIADVASTRIPELEAVRWQGRTESGIEAGYDVATIAKESALQERLGVNREGLSERAKKALAASDRLHYVTREAAADAGMHVVDLDGKLVEISRLARRDVLTRQTTPEAQNAIFRGEGKLYDAIVEVLATENGIGKDKIAEVLEREFTEARGLHKLDPLETRRSLRYFPSHVRLPSGEVVRLLETNLLRHGKRLAGNAAKRIGTVQEYGEDKPLGQPVEGVTGRELPTPYREIVGKYKGPDQELIATAFRAMTGMPTSKPSRVLEPGSTEEKFVRFLAEVNNLAAAGKMTFGAPLQNLVEMFGTSAAMLGQKRVSEAWGEAVSALSEGRIREFVEGRQQAGGFAMNAPEWLLGGEGNAFASMLEAMRTAKNAALVPMELTQAFNDSVVHRALQKAVEGWREGRAEPGDVTTLQALYSMPREQAQQIVSGQAPTKSYETLQLTGLTRLTRRGDLPINKSDFARSNVAHWLKFVGFFQRQIETYRRSIVAMRDAETPAEASAAAAQFLKLNGFNLAAYFAGQSLIKVMGGIDELAQFWRETIEDVQTPGGAARLAGAAFLGSLLGSPGSVIAGGAHAIITGREKEKAQVFDTVANVVPVIGTVMRGSEFVDAALHNLAGTSPDASSPYSGKSPLQEIGYYIGTQVPLVRWAENGPLGLSLHYLGSDPKLEGALRAGRRWDEKHDIPIPESQSDAQFAEAMRAAVNRLKGKDPNIAEIAAEIGKSIPDSKTETSVYRSLLARRVLSGTNWTQLSQEQQAAKLRSLGEGNVELLRGYDAVLERTAQFFKPYSFR